MPKETARGLCDLLLQPGAAKVLIDQAPFGHRVSAASRGHLQTHLRRLLGKPAVQVTHKEGVSGSIAVDHMETRDSCPGDNGSSKTMPSVSKSRNSFLKLLGPGLITGAADDDPSGIATYSQVGAQFGFGIVGQLRGRVSKLRMAIWRGGPR